MGGEVVVVLSRFLLSFRCFFPSPFGIVAYTFPEGPATPAAGATNDEIDEISADVGKGLEGLVEVVVVVVIPGL